MRILLFILFLFFSLSITANEGEDFGITYSEYVAEAYCRTKEEVYTQTEWEKLTNEEKSNLYYATYYVASSTQGTGNGLSEANAWSLTTALANDSPGDIFYCKAGDYGTATYTFSTSGAAGNPIKFIGYKTTINDIVASNGSTWGKTDDALPTEAPTLQGTRTNSIGSGTAITISGAYVEVHNFQFRWYNTGGTVSGQYSGFNNCLSSEMGNFNPSDSYTLGNTANASQNYAGFGFNITADNAFLTNCVVSDAGAEGVRVGGDFQTHSYNYIYSNDNTNYIDYLYAITAPSATVSNCTITDVILENTSTSYSDHGFSIKANAFDNLIENCTGIGVSFELQYASGINNVLRGNVSQANAVGKKGNVTMANGSNANTVYNHLFKDGGRVVIFETCEWDMGVGGDCDREQEILFPGDLFRVKDNRVINCIFIGTGSVDDRQGAPIQFDYFNVDYTTTPTKDFYVEGCIFYNWERLVNSESANENTKFINCIIDTFSDTVISRDTFNEGTNYGFTVSADTFQYCNFSNVNFTVPTGINITTYNPLFTNAAGGDFTLQSGSQLINAGLNTSTGKGLNTVDFLGNTRDANYDIGAYEFGGTPTGGNKRKIINALLLWN